MHHTVAQLHMWGMHRTVSNNRVRKKETKDPMTELFVFKIHNNAELSVLTSDAHYAYKSIFES